MAFHGFQKYFFCLPRELVFMATVWILALEHSFLGIATDGFHDLHAVPTPYSSKSVEHGAALSFV